MALNARAFGVCPRRHLCTLPSHIGGAEARFSLPPAALDLAGSPAFGPLSVLFMPFSPGGLPTCSVLIAGK